MISVIFAGDFCPAFIKDNEPLYISGLEQIRELNSRVDYSILNLECPCTKSTANVYFPIAKQGPSLIGNSRAVEIVKQAGFSAVTLANNHIFDYGETALKQTINCLKELGIDYVGANIIKEEAASTLYKNIGNSFLSIINCCEHEFSVATDDHGGANPLDPVSQYYQIQEAKKISDYVVMIIHGGVEHLQYPTQRMVKLYRFFVDAGADAVINHHQHCPCGYELYKGKPIFYGLGNFFFPWKGKSNSIWNQGYMVKLNLDTGGIDYEVIPYCQCNNSLDITLLEGKDLESFTKMMRELSNPIKDEILLKSKFKTFNKENDYLYRKMLEPYSGRILNALYKRGILPSFVGKERVLALMDFLGCESHYERVMDYLDDKYNQFFYE